MCGVFRDRLKLQLHRGIVCIWTTGRLPDCSINFHIWKNWLFS